MIHPKRHPTLFVDSKAAIDIFLSFFLRTKWLLHGSTSEYFEESLQPLGACIENTQASDLDPVN